jgi:hypothetical protein
VSLWHIVLIVGGRFGAISGLLRLSRQIEQLIRVQIRQGELLQTTIEHEARENGANLHRLHEALLASGVTRCATDLKRLNESSEWAEFTAWADVEKRKRDAS